VVAAAVLAVGALLPEVQLVSDRNMCGSGEIVRRLQQHSITIVSGDDTDQIHVVVAVM
jgi:hypothetical protein